MTANTFKVTKGRQTIGDSMPVEKNDTKEVLIVTKGTLRKGHCSPVWGRHVERAVCCCLPARGLAPSPSHKGGEGGAVNFVAIFDLGKISFIFQKNSRQSIVG